MKQKLASGSSVRDGERMLATLLANLPGMAYRCRNDENWTMGFVSDGCRELTGYAPEDLVGNRKISCEEIIHVLDRTRVRDEVAAALQDGRRFELTYRIVTAHGVQRWVMEHGVAIPAAEGAEAWLEGIVTDITARKYAEEALAEKESTLAVILDNSFQYTSLLDPDGRMLRANQTSLNAVGAGGKRCRAGFSGTLLGGLIPRQSSKNYAQRLHVPHKESLFALKPRMSRATVSCRSSIFPSSLCATPRRKSSRSWRRVATLPIRRRPSGPCWSRRTEFPKPFVRVRTRFPSMISKPASISRQTSGTKKSLA